MRRRSLLVAAASTGALNVLPKGAKATAAAAAAQSFPVLDSLAMVVTPEENRQYSFTDKASAYFYGRTHQDKPDDWFFGWNVATKRIFQDYRLIHNGKPLLRAGAKAVVSPHAMTRDYGAVKETLRLFDGLTALMVEVETTLSGPIGFEFTGDLLSVGEVGAEGVWHRPKEAPNSWLLLAPIEGGGQGYFILLGASKADVRRVLSQLRRNHQSLTRARMARMEALVSGSRALDAGDPDRTKALLWMRLTADQLVMQQMGTGIYAGLPWFNDYWGRDTFISITGTLFVTGQYDVAADVFRSFAALQDTDPKSKTYGRIPNRARPDGVQYNTADGTPRFIITLADLVQRSGNDALAKELSPTVKRAIEGVLANNVDEHGLITHDDADTWMDAKEKGVRAFSPRGNRAIDVQALWIEAFDGALALQYPAEAAWEDAAAVDLNLAWRRPIEAARAKLSASLALFRESRTGFLVDHLRADGSQDLSKRPNVLFALSIPIPFGAPKFDPNPSWASLERDMIQTRNLWKSLVYPWGVATLTQEDSNFYPYHEHWHYYHKDAAYHNGTVWPWLNGIAIQRLVEFNQIGPAWQLFENMNSQALREGAVGSLAECADALPLAGARRARLTGTFLQAWSNAEHLRVWQECFLGIKPTSKDALLIRPRLPITLTDVLMKVPFSKGCLDAHYHIRGEQRWRFTWHGSDDVLLDFDAPDVLTVSLLWSIKNDQTIEFWVKDSILSAQVTDIKSGTVEPVPAFFIGSQTRGIDFPLEDQERVARQRRAMENRIFADLGFCEPKLAPNLKSLSVYHDPPLTY